MLETALLVMGVAAVGVAALFAQIRPYKGLRIDLGRHRVAMLQRVATPRGATVVGDRGLVLDAGEVRIEVTLEIHEGHASSAAVRCTLHAPGGVAFELSTERAGGGLFGDHGVELGLVPAFDRCARLTARDERLVRRIWTAARCNTVTEIGRIRLVADETQLELALLDPPVGPTLGGAIDLVLDLARVDALGLSALRGLADATPIELGVELAGPGNLRITVDREGPTRFTRARAEAGLVARDPIELGTSSAAYDQLPPGARERARALGPARLAVTSDAITITWPTIEDDPRRLQAAVDVLRAMVLERSGADGVFR